MAPVTRKGTRKATAMSRARRPPHFPLMLLPDDILYDIIDQVAKMPWLPFKGKKSCHFTPFAHLKVLSSANKRLRALSIPTLFRRVMLLDCRCHDWRPAVAGPIDRIFESLKHLVTSPEILKVVRYFIIAAHEADGIFCLDIPAALFQCWQMMPKLEEVSLQLRGGGGSSLVPLLRSYAHFNPQVPLLDNIVSLSVSGPHSDNLDGLLKFCPNLQNVAVDIYCCIKHTKFLASVVAMPKLKYLMLRRIAGRPRDGEMPFGWTPADVLAIFHHAPKIRHLALVGQLENTCIKNFIDHFASFKHLEELNMTDEQVVTLDEAVEYVGVMQEGDIDMVDSEEFDFGEIPQIVKTMSAKHHLNKDRTLMAKKFFRVCASLKRLSLTRNDRGKLFERIENKEDGENEDLDDEELDDDYDSESDDLFGEDVDDVDDIEEEDEDEHMESDDYRIVDRTRSQKSWRHGYPSIMQANLMDMD